MKKCWISFYLGICLLFSFLTVQSQTVAQFAFTSTNNPANFNHPETIGVWSQNQNERGNVLFSFSPIRNNDRTISPGKNYTLKYRMFVYNGTFSAAEGKEIWIAKGPEFSIKKQIVIRKH